MRLVRHTLVAVLLDERELQHHSENNQEVGGLCPPHPCQSTVWPGRREQSAAEKCFEQVTCFYSFLTRDLLIFFVQIVIK